MILIFILNRFLKNFYYLATWLATEGARTWKLGKLYTALWAFEITIMGLAASLAVNALVTSLIVFKILKVFLEIKPTSIERTLGSLASNTNSSTAAGGASGSSGSTTQLRHIIFIIIESGMVLFAIQLVRIVLSTVDGLPTPIFIGLELVMPMHQMLNVIRSCSFLC